MEDNPTFGTRSMPEYFWVVALNQSKKINEINVIFEEQM